jgi:hypothetical protein
VRGLLQVFKGGQTQSLKHSKLEGSLLQQDI